MPVSYRTATLTEHIRFLLPSLHLHLHLFCCSYAVLLTEASQLPASEEGRVQALSAAFELVRETEPETDVRHRAMLAIATLVCRTRFLVIGALFPARSLVLSAFHGIFLLSPSARMLLDRDCTFVLTSHNPIQVST